MKTLEDFKYYVTINNGNLSLVVFCPDCAQSMTYCDFITWVNSVNMHNCYGKVVSAPK